MLGKVRSRSMATLLRHIVEIIKLKKLIRQQKDQEVEAAIKGLDLQLDVLQIKDYMHFCRQYRDKNPKKQYFDYMANLHFQLTALKNKLFQMAATQNKEGTHKQQLFKINKQSLQTKVKQKMQKMQRQIIHRDEKYNGGQLKKRVEFNYKAKKLDIQQSKNFQIKKLAFRSRTQSQKSFSKMWKDIESIPQPESFNSSLKQNLKSIRFVRSSRLIKPAPRPKAKPLPPKFRLVSARAFSQQAKTRLYQSTYKYDQIKKQQEELFQNLIGKRLRKNIASFNLQNMKTHLKNSNLDQLDFITKFRQISSKIDARTDQLFK